MSGPPFIKMNGLGNDFVIFDARRTSIEIAAEQARAIADRHGGVGCDQVIVIEPPASASADAFMRIFNADGGEVGACGNATRCVAAILMEEKDAGEAVIETAAGLLAASSAGGGTVTVDMGRAELDWPDIPLAREADTLHLGIEAGPLKDPVAVGFGNSHAVFFVEHAEAAPLETYGPIIERHEIFPEHANVGAAQVLGEGEIRLRVWERGVGLTKACGTGACAAAVAANRRNLTGRAVDVVLDGGRLAVEWLAGGNVIMTGPVAVSFTGVLDRSLLDPE